MDTAVKRTLAWRMVGVSAEQVVLWETAGGLRCTFDRRPTGPPFEVTVVRGTDVVTRMAFEHDEDAAAFAIAAMHQGDTFDSAGVPVRGSAAADIIRNGN